MDLQKKEQELKQLAEELRRKEIELDKAIASFYNVHKISSEEVAVRNTLNNKYPVQDIMYQGRWVNKNNKPLRLNVDVRDFVQPRDSSVNKFVRGIKIATQPNDVKAYEVQNLVKNKLRYVGDKENSGHAEFWQFPFETMILSIGDCDDGSILMATCLIAAGIPNWRVRVAAGLVKTDSVTAPTGGHAYCCYCRESDNNWVVLDWCYYPDNTVPVAKKQLLRDNKNYLDVWFSFNDEYAWGRKSLVFNGTKSG